MSSDEASPTVSLKDRRALVAIDLGAESCRVSLLRWSNDAPVIELVHRFSNHVIDHDDGLRWDLDAILKNLHTGLRRCAEFAPEGIRSIAVDGWAVDYVRLGAHGECLAPPFCYRDPRTLASEAVLHQKLSPQRMRQLTGIQLLPLNTVYQMAADNVQDRQLPWLNLPEYVLYTFGAEPVSELTNATHTQLVGLDGTWSQAILEALEIPLSSMPKLVPPGTDLGKLQGQLTNLSAFHDTRLIAPACHDTASAIAAIPDTGDDWAYISSGTWSLVGTLLHQPNNTTAACADNFTNLGGVDGTVCFHKNVNGMWLLRQCMQTWDREGTSHNIASIVNAAAQFPSRGYVLDVDDPELLLPGNMPARINAQLRRRGLPELSPAADDAAAMAAFLFHSLAARYAEVLRKIEAVTGRHFRKLYIMGGGSQNEWLNQLTAQATGLVVVRAGTECSTLGNFAAQLATLEATAGKRPTAAWAQALKATKAPQL